MNAPISFGRTGLRLGTMMGVAAIGLGIAPGARADLITDGSFESVASLSPGGYLPEATGQNQTTGPSGGWIWSTGSTTSPYNSSVLINVGDASDSSPWVTPATQTGFDGSYVVGLQGEGSVSQSFVNTEGSGLFDLSYVLAGRGAETSAGFQTVAVSLEDTTTSSFVLGGSGTTTGGSDFLPQDVAVSLTEGDSYLLTFFGITGNGDDQTALLDSVSLDEAVPEPASLGILGAGLAGLGILRRRKKA